MYSSHNSNIKYIGTKIKYVGFKLIHYAINIDTFSSYMVFSKFNYIFLMIPFSTGTGLESVGSWAGPGLLLGWSVGSRRGSPLQKQEKRGGRRGLCPWPLRCLIQFLSERKDRLLGR